MARVAVFDAYGTLLDVDAAMRAHAARLGPDWRCVSQDWRAKHLEYTWVRSLAGPALHRDFWQLAQDSLAVVAARHGITDTALLADVLRSYRRLDAYPEVPEMLRGLKTKGIARAILSNGEPAMLAEAARAAGIADLLDDTLSVESVGVYKPDPRVYRLASERFGVSAAEVAFFSSNPWDAFGARSFGFQVFWVNRAGQPDEYGLRGGVTELRDLCNLSLKQTGEA
jgi:2-haloacid dehalogenase